MDSAAHALRQLLDTARDLARLRDPDAVLRSIVHRARMLLAADVSYLSMNDSAGTHTYMRVTDGCTSAVFQQLLIGMGEGLGGKVAQSALPYAATDYLVDERFRHTETIDAAVRDEGLTSILGVPLSLGGSIIGVLYAADRSTRTFSPEEVALLSSFADHAAIAIDNAKLLEETQRTLAELNTANEVIRAQNEAMQRAEQAHDQLTELVLRGADAPMVAAAVGEVLGGGIVLHDVYGVELARVGTPPVVPDPEVVANSRGAGRALRTGGDWVCAVLAGGEQLGSLLLTGRADLSNADRRLFERAVMVTALLLLLRRSVAQAEDQVRGELLTDLLTAPDRSPAALIARGQHLGVDLTTPHAVLIAHCDEVPRGRLAVAAAEHAELVGVHAEQVVLLAEEREPGPFAEKLAQLLGERLAGTVTVGAAGPAAGPVELAAAHAEAARCLRTLLALDWHGRGAALSGLGFVGLLLGGQADIRGYVQTTIGPVLDYDARRGTELARTMRAYFAAGTQLTRTKDVLHVHVNTVVQRLERVASLLGKDWQAPQRALEIQLALRLHHLADT